MLTVVVAIKLNDLYVFGWRLRGVQVIAVREHATGQMYILRPMYISSVCLSVPLLTVPVLSALLFPCVLRMHLLEQVCLESAQQAPPYHGRCG